MYSWVEHTSELELHVDAADEAGVLEDALRALRELLTAEAETPVEGERELRVVTVEADDRAALLAAWLEELVFMAETESLIPDAVEFEAIDQRGVRARVAAVRDDPPHLVKAVTYHRLAFEPTGDGWRATVVLDV